MTNVMKCPFGTGFPHLLAGVLQVLRFETGRAVLLTNQATRSSNSNGRRGDVGLKLLKLQANAQTLMKAMTDWRVVCQRKVLLGHMEADLPMDLV